MSSGYRSRFDVLAATVLTVAAACDRPETVAPSSAVIISDSAGIEIVESHAPQWDDGTGWTVAPEPEIAIGGYTRAGEPRDSSHLVWDIRDVVPLSDGGVAMLSGGEQKVFVFESSGAFSTSIGRVGQGPGEYRYPDHLQVLPGDTLVLWDVMGGPVGYFDPSGRLLREWRIDVGALSAAGRKVNLTSRGRAHLPLADGSFIVQVGLSPAGFIPPLGVPYRWPVEFFSIDSTYTAHSLGRWEGDEHLHLYPWGPPVLPFPFGVQLAAGGTPTSVYISNTDRYEVHRYSTTGVLQRIVRRTAEPIPIAAREIQEWKEEFPAIWYWSNWDRAMAKLPPREFRPPISGLLVDSQGYLWVMDSYRLDRSGSEWSVFDPAGHWLGRLEIPLWRVEWVGEDLILGVSRDPHTGVQVVEGYRLNRNAGPS